MSFRIKRIALIVAFLATSLASRAQVLNRLGVDEDVFKVYSACRLNPDDPANLSVADSLKTIADKRNDYKIMTLALNLAFPAQYAADDYEGMDNTISELKTLRARHKDINDIYYVAIYTYTQYLLYLDRNSDALFETNEMMRNATVDAEPYGLMLAYRALAVIYDYRDNPSMSSECYKRAYTYCKQANADVEIPTILLLLSQEQIRLGQFYEAGHTLEMASDKLNDYPFSITLYNYMNAYLGYASEDNELFWKYYEIIENDPLYPSVLDEDSRNMISANYYITKGDLKTALEYAKNIWDEKVRTREMANIYEIMGEYKLSTEQLTRFMAVSDSLNAMIQAEDIAALDLEIDNFELQSESQRMRSRAQILAITSLTILLAMILAGTLILNIRGRRQAKIIEKKNQELEEATNTAVEALKKEEAASATKTRFLQNMSHEIRTPLNAVVGFSQLMSLPEGFISDEEKTSYNSYIMNNAKMLTMLVDDILSLSDVENGNYKVEIQSCLCNEVALYTMKSTEYRVPPGVNMYYTSDVDDTYAIQTDERRVQQVLINFLTNACKHTEKGEIHLHLSTSEVPGMIAYSVTDTGTGVPEDKAEVIFGRFVKLDQFKQGAGIGLNICKIIAQNLGGDVYLDTSYKNGARFVFTLPNK